MDNRIDIIRHLYGEEVDWPALRARLEGEEGFKAEHDALGAVKFQLDHRKRARPDPRVLGAVLAAAAQDPLQAELRGPRQDRAARPRRAWRTGRLLSLAGTAVVLLTAMGIGFWQTLMPSVNKMTALTEETASLAVEQEAARSEAYDRTPEALQAPSSAAPEQAAPGRVASRAPSRAAVRAVAPSRPALSAGGTAAAKADAVPVELAWDDAGDVRRLHRRVEILQARAAQLSWDDPVMTPEMLLPESRSPASGTLQGLTPASGQRYRDAP